MVNDYRESHAKVWVANAVQTITHHMNYRWGFLFQLLFYMAKGIYTSGETQFTFSTFYNTVVHRGDVTFSTFMVEVVHILCY